MWVERNTLAASRRPNPTGKVAGSGPWRQIGRSLLVWVSVSLMGLAWATPIGAQSVFLDEARVTVRAQIPQVALLLPHTPQVIFSEEDVTAGVLEGRTLVVTRSDAIRLEYVGNVDVEISVSSPQELVHQSTGRALPPDRLAWRLLGADGWEPFAEAERRLAIQPPGQRTLHLDLRLLVELTDLVGEYRANLVFTVLAADEA